MSYYAESSRRSIYAHQPFTNRQILNGTELKALADDKFNDAKMSVSVHERVENIVGNGVDAGYQHFLLFPQCFTKPSSFRSLKVGIVR